MWKRDVEHNRKYIIYIVAPLEDDRYNSQYEQKFYEVWPYGLYRTMPCMLARLKDDKLSLKGAWLRHVTHFYRATLC